MKTEDAKELKKGEEIFFAGAFYEVADNSRLK